MSLTLIIGPMKSGKSEELIARALPHSYANRIVIFLKPKRDVRSNNISSRLGSKVPAVAIDSLGEAPPYADVYAIDEAHMFSTEDVDTVDKWLRRGKKVICSGLNTDHAGRLMPTIAGLLELSPETLINKQAICEKCYGDATNTQVLDGDKVIDKSLPPEVPDDGKYKYIAVCRRCFQR